MSRDMMYSFQSISVKHSGKCAAWKLEICCIIFIFRSFDDLVKPQTQVIGKSILGDLEDGVCGECLYIFVSNKACIINKIKIRP